MAKKAFVSFLGTSNYVEFIYKIDGKISVTNKDGKISLIDDMSQINEGDKPLSTRFIQEALVEKYCKDWGKDDAILIFATTKAKKKNWKDNGHEGEREELYNEGLYSRLKAMQEAMQLNPELRIVCIIIPEVESQENIWDLFDIVNNEIKNYKEIYFDITHAYRFIPMFAMSLFNYSQFVNGTEVKWVKYAMLDNIGDLKEVRKKPLEDEDRIQTVLDLTSLIKLQDWTFAAGQYLKSGNVKQLVEMKDKVKKEELTPIGSKIIDKLGIVIKERQTCRGIKIHTSENVKKLKELLRNYKTQECKKSEEPLHNILGKIDESLQYFKDYPDVMNGFYAAKWCCDNGLYQQAITMLREDFITAFCVRNKLDYKKKYERKYVEDALNLKNNNRKDALNLKNKKRNDVEDGNGFKELTENIKEAEEVCNKKIKEAEEVCNKKINEAEEVCNKKINEAKEERNDKIKEAEEEHNDKIKEAEEERNDKIKEAEEERNDKIKEAEKRKTDYKEKVKELMNDKLLKDAIDKDLWENIRNYRNNFNHNGMNNNFPAEKLEKDIERFVNETIVFFNPKPQE